MKILARGERGFADRDLYAARVLYAEADAEDFANIIAFHAHQSAEKYLKGLIVTSGEDPPRIHALPGLLQEVVTHFPDLDSQELRDAANDLNGFYIPSRYPAEVGGPHGPITASEAAEALSWAEAIAAEIRPRLEGY